MTTLAQQRAAFALEQLEEHLSNLPANQCAEFGTFTAGVPAMILQNGFGQTLAFMLAKAGGKETDKHHIAYAIITGWLCNRQYLQGNNPIEILRYINQQMSQADYLQAQRETLDLFEWVKRFANAELF